MVIAGADENSAALQISPAALQNSDAPAAFHPSLVCTPQGQKIAQDLNCAHSSDKRPWKGLAAGMDSMDSLRREVSHGENSLKLAFRKRFLALPRGRTRGLPRRANVRQGVPRCAESAGRALDRLRVAAVSLAGCARR
jgi:hypothetical protein